MADVTTIDWNAVYDAYGPAAQAPDRIDDLKGDRAQRDRAADWIFGAVLHQRTPFPAITPLLRVLPVLLRDPAFAPGHEILLGAVRIAAVGYELMTDAWEPSQDGQDEMIEEDPELAPYVIEWPAFLDAMRGVSVHIAPFLHSADTELRAVASACLASLAAVPGASPVVGIAAALLSPDDHQRALDMLIDALERPAELDALFLGRGSAEAPARASRDANFSRGLHGRTGFMRFTVIGEVIRRSASPDRAMPAFLAVVRERASSYTVDVDWGRILGYVFASAAPGDELTHHQRALLTEIVSNTQLWEPLVGNAGKHFDDAGLPFDRTQLRDILRANRMPRPAA